MASVGSISIKATLNTSDYEAGKAKVIKGNKDIKASSDDIDDRGVAKLGAGTQLATTAMVALSAAAVAAGAAAVAGLGVVGVQAVKSFAEMEQLSGGVEKLFGAESAKIVEQNARNAFKTAQISAEEYMTTATRFSAKLVKDLGGDTKAAAEMVDVAIRDMGDNANTFGTSMDTLIQTYQGFAKQNYTMLDNLNLGYGGTAEQMAKLVNDSRVLGDTTEVTARTINDVSFDKIIQAINVIQKEVGIYGTSLKEAETTISGSWKMMTASWQNMLSGTEGSGAALGTSIRFLFTNLVNQIPGIITGLAGNVHAAFLELIPKESQFGEKLNSINESIKVLFTGDFNGGIFGLDEDHDFIKFLISGNNLLEQVKGFLLEVGDKAVATFQWIGDMWNQYIAPPLNDFINQLVPLIKTAIDNFAATFERIKPVVMVVAAVIGGALLLAIGLVVAAFMVFIGVIVAVWTIASFVVRVIWEAIMSIPGFITGMVDTIMGIINTVGSFIAGMFNTVIGIISGFISSVINFFAELFGFVGGVFRNIWNIISSVFSTVIGFISGVVGDIIGFFAGVPGQIGGFFQDAWNRITGIFGSIGSWFSGLGGQLVGAGQNIIDGLIRGISGGKDAVINKIKEIAGGALDAIKNFFGIHSPSRVMRDEVGLMLMAGLSIGINRGEDKAVRSAMSASESVLSGFGGSAGFSSSLTGTGYINEDISIFANRASAGGASIVNNYSVHNDVDVEKISRQQDYILRTKRR